MTSEAALPILRLAEVGRTREARHLLAKAMAEAPEDIDLLAARGIIAYQEDEYLEAEEALQQALGLDPTYSPAKHMLARVALEKKEYPRAEALVLEVLAEHPEDADAFATYARIMMETLHLEKARALAEESLRLDPDESEAQVVLLLLEVMEGDQGIAQERLRQMIAESPDEGHVVASLFVILTDAGRHAEALEVGREILRENPDNEAMVDAMVNLRAVSHWTAIPLRPLARWGWTASAAIWIVFAVLIRAIEALDPDLALWVAGVFVAYVVYSWVWPTLLRRWLRWRGF